MEPIDDFVLNHLGEFEEKKLVSADRADISLPEGNEAVDDEEKKNKDTGSPSLQKDEEEALVQWLKETLGDKVADVIISKRLVDSPAMIVNPDGYMTSSMERVIAMSRQEKGMLAENSKKNMEINPANPLIKRLAAIMKDDGDFAAEVAEQIYDNAMIQAGLLVNHLDMVKRNYRILNRATQG
jgi:molecular chaperone HtpG